jgi:hypothetical protein
MHRYLGSLHATLIWDVVGFVQVVICDVDVMWLRDPQPFFKQYPDADVLTSSDHLTPTIGGAEKLEKYPDAGSAFNIGVATVLCVGYRGVERG